MILDKAQKRVLYRIKENVSYTGQDAVERIYKVAREIAEQSSALNDYILEML